ncbi:MAG TPA: L-dopachrome tautomerase-related protein, partial [Flavisolibacter sp.]|nr:L-dopachrome tautomerase-related protein [Flavisolibacter sp.]
AVGTDATLNTTGRQDSLELVYLDSTYQLTGVAKEEGGYMWVNYPRWSDTYRYGVVRVTGTNMREPYPDSIMNKWQTGQAGTNKWVCVQSVYVDDSSRLWVLDPAAPKMENIQAGGAKLVRINKATGATERTYSFNGVIPDSAYMNDVRVDVQRNVAYLTESKGGGIVVLDLNSGKARRVLHNHYSVKSDTLFRFVIDGQELMKEGKPVKINSDGIALTPDGAWLYYKPLTDNKLYRVRTEDLRNASLTDAALASRVEDLGRFTTTDGMIFDKVGNLYLGDLQNYSIVRIDKDHKMTTLVKDQRLLWPDSYAIADGYLYITCSQIHKQPEYNNGVNKRTSPYTVYRLKL